MFENRLKKLRESKGLTQKQVAEMLGINSRTYSSYENNEREPNSEILILISNLFNVSVDKLLGISENIDYDEYNIRPVELKKFPMLGEIACGKPIMCNQDYETYVEASAKIKADFCLTAHGDSMINARIFDGDVIFIKEQPTVDNGEIAAIIIDDEATLKRVYRKADRIILRPENPTYDDIVIEEDELNNVRIIGKAVAFMSYVK